MNEQHAGHEIIKVAHKLYDSGFVVATDGNISVKIAPDKFLFTPTGICKGDLTEDDLLVCDGRGRTSAEGRLTSEAPMHLEAYHRRPDINAVIHAHPPYTVALSLAGISFENNLLPEAIMTLGQVPTAPFAVPSTPEGADVIKGLIENHDVIILDRHGSLTVGKTLTEAYHRLERLEFCAKVTFIARLIGKPQALTDEQIERIKAVGTGLK